MDEDAISADQARLLRQGLEQAGIGVTTLWMSYFRLGGDASQLEVEAYLHHALELPPMQRNLLAQAMAELADGHRIPLVPFTWDYPTTPTGGDPPAPADPVVDADPPGEDPDAQRR